MRAFGIASLSSTALYVGGKCRKPGTKKLFDFPEENMIYYPALSEQRKRKSGFRCSLFFYAQGGGSIGTHKYISGKRTCK